MFIRIGEELNFIWEEDVLSLLLFISLLSFISLLLFISLLSFISSLSSFSFKRSVSEIVSNRIRDKKN